MLLFFYFCHEDTFYNCCILLNKNKYFNQILSKNNLSFEHYNHSVIKFNTNSLALIISLQREGLQWVSKE